MKEIVKKVICSDNPTITIVSEERNEYIENVLLNNNVIGYVLQGTKRIIGRGEIEQGEVYYMPVGDYYINYRNGKSGLYEEILITFNSEDVLSMVHTLVCKYKFPDFVASHEPIYIPFCKKEQCTELTSEIFNHIKTVVNIELDDNTKDVIIKICLYQLIVSVIADVDSVIGQALVELLEHDNNRFQVVVSNSVDRSCTIEEMAHECGISIAQFKKLFQDLYGTTPHRWIIEHQMRKASVLLEVSNMMISEIALSCNFKDSSHLIKQFRTNFGTTPSAYRRQSRQKNRATVFSR